MLRVASLALCAALLGCVPVHGGAVELSWVVYCSGGEKPGGSAPCSCTARAPALARVRLAVVAEGDAGGADLCSGHAACEFDAGLQSGTTDFFIPAGDYSISLVPLDAGGNALGGPGCVAGTCTATADCPAGVCDGGQCICWPTPQPIRRTVVSGQLVTLGSLLISVPECPLASGCTGTCG